MKRRFGAFRSALRGRFAAPQGEVDKRGLRVAHLLSLLGHQLPRASDAIAAIPAYSGVSRFVSDVDEAKNSANERIHFAKRNEGFRIAGRKSLKSL